MPQHTRLLTADEAWAHLRSKSFGRFARVPLSDDSTNVSGAVLPSDCGWAV